MKLQFYMFLFTIVFFSCNFKDSKNEKNIVSVEKKSTKAKKVNVKSKASIPKKYDSLNKKIIGIWTTDDNENAVFQIKAKTIYYVDQFADYKYFLNGNKITINYPDYIYTATIEFKEDTLIMSSKEYGKAKFWKFKD